MYAPPSRRNISMGQIDSSDEESNSHGGMGPGMEEHAPGALIRIRMKNFVTYASAEFKCGPSLNMVLGPNGTGKSSLVCAICLGLGWAPAQLGRAKDIGEFVKNGSREAEIEIELKAGARHRGRNPVVKRIIKREGNKSSWLLNSATTTHKEVQGLMRYFGIQVDNLCQFLPQDKVADFAALSPVELLQQTQKAVGTAEMSEWHEQLKKLGAERRKNINDRSQIDKNLAELQSRQNQQKAEVERLRERNVLKVKLEALQAHRVAVKYQAEKDRYDHAKDRKTVAKNELRELEREVEPILQGANEKEEYCKRIQAVLDQRKQMVERSKRQADGCVVRIENHKRKLENCFSQIKTIQRSKSERNAGIIRLKNKLASLEGRLKNEPPAFDPREFNERKRHKEAEIRAVQNQISTKDELMRPKVDEAKRFRAQMAQLDETLKTLDTAAGKQNQKLKKLSPDTFKAWEAIQQHQDEFDHEILGPPIITCTVKQQNLAPALESVLQRSDLMAFTVQSDEDSKKLQHMLYRQMKLADISVRTINRPLTHFKSNVEASSLRKYGFDGWLLDAVQGPEKVLAMLCDTCKLHKVAYSTSRDDIDLERIKQSPIDIFVTRDVHYSISRRAEYGPDAVSTSVRSIREKGIWSDSETSSGDSEVREQLKTVTDTFEELKQEIQEVRDQKKELEGQARDILQEVKAIEREKAELQKERSTWDMIPVEIEQERTLLQAAMAEQANEGEAILESIRKREKLALERGQFAIDFSIALNTVRKMVSEHFEAQLLLAEGQSDLKNLQLRNKEIVAMVKQRSDELQNLQQEISQMKAILQQMQRQLLQERDRRTEEEKRIQDEFDMHCRQEGHESGQARLQELEAEVTSLTQRLELVDPGNGSLMVEYEKRARDIERISSRVEEVADVIVRLNGQIQEIRTQWEPELDALIEEINTAFAYNFTQIKCAGQISVHKDEEDFADWAIKIMVKFRENEQMSVLNSQRQSGGERAVTTIFYLMALQSRAQSPFRVVDEINQGMDPRNERMVHERMVDIACSENTSQYFLITPKLLSGLKYHPRMVVHTIYSGETMPEDNSTLDFNKWANIALRLAGTVN